MSREEYTDEETSGVIDVSNILGSDTQNAFLIDVQAHFNLGGELRNARRSARPAPDLSQVFFRRFNVVRAIPTLGHVAYGSRPVKLKTSKCFRSSSPLQIAGLLMRKAAVTGRGGLEYVGRSIAGFCATKKLAPYRTIRDINGPRPLANTYSGMAAGFRLEGVAYRQVTMW